MEERAGLVRNCVNSHEETKSTALKRDEQQVQAFVDNLNQAMTDPSNMPYKYIPLQFANTKARRKTSSGLM
jgi:hypothetical protein